MDLFEFATNPHHEKMFQFTTDLKKRIDIQIELLEKSEICITQKTLEASKVLGKAFNNLKTFTLSYDFKNEEEEIYFFKEIKPKFCFRLIYYRKVFNIEMNRSIGVDKQREYLSDLMDSINSYNLKRLYFIRYYRSNASHLDKLYFLRNRTDVEQYLETFYYELDPDFSTNCDFKVAKTLANDMLSAYLMTELGLLSDNNTVRKFSFPTKKTWKGAKAELQEQIFGDIPLTQLYEYIQNVFNIQLDTNISRTLDDLKIRNNPTPFLDKL